MERKIVLHLDYLYGPDASSYWPIRELSFETSKRTGRIKRIYWKGKLLGTVRENGSIALSLLGARLLARCERIRNEYCVVVSKDAVEPVSQGKSVFAKHVLYSGDKIRPKMDVIVLDPDGNVIAVGQSTLSARAMKEMDRGVAIKVREGLKKSSTDT